MDNPGQKVLAEFKFKCLLGSEQVLNVYSRMH